MTNKPMLSVELKLNDRQECDLIRFNETCEDSQPYDVSKERMKSLARIGLVRSLGFSRYEITDVGSAAVYKLLEFLRNKQAAQHQGGVTLEQVLKAYDYANSHPHKYLRGTTNWCAAVAHALNVQHPAPAAVVLPDRLKTEPFTTIDRGSKNYKSGYNAAIAEVAKLNGLKP